MNPIRVVIVDDEHLARERVRDLASEMADLQIVGEAAKGPDAVAMIDELRPDVVLLDISLPAMNAFEVLSCLEVEPLPLIVFMTAYEEHAIRAFEVRAIDYLLKPIEPERFAEAIERVREHLAHAARTTEEPIREWIAQESNRSSRLVVRSGNRILFLKPAEIDYIEAVGNYVRIVRGSEKLLMRQTLAALDTRLQPAGFIRVQRALLVNMDRIAELRREGKEMVSAILTTGERFRVSEHYRPALEKALQVR